MKKTLQLILAAMLVLFVGEAFAQQGFGTNQPNKSSAVDIVSSKRGLLIPRVDLTSTTVSAPITGTPAQSLLVYNKNTAGDVTPGYYYWESGKWIRFVASDTEKTVSVSEGENISVTSTTIGNDTNYEVSVKQGQADQVLVTKADGSGTVWIDPADFIADVVTASNGLNKVGNDVQLGGTLDKATEITTTTTNTLAITNLEDVSTSFNGTNQNIVVMGSDGILKITSPKSMVEDAIVKDNLTAKTLNGDSMINVVDGANAVLKEVSLNIINESITSEKIKDGEVKTSDLADQNVTAGKLVGDGVDAGKVATVNADGSVSYKNVSSANVEGKNLTAGDGSIEVINGDGATLIDANVKVADLGISTAKLADDAVTTEKIADGTIQNVDLKDKEITAVKLNADGITEGFVPTVNADGTVTYKEISSTLGKTLSTDGKIVIGTTNASTLANAVLVDTELKIAEGSITSAEIADGTIQAIDIADAGANQVLVTGADNKAVWVDQTTIESNDTFEGTAPITVTGTPSTTTGGTDYLLDVANANGTTLGVVKEADADATINFVDGVASVNIANLSSQSGKALTSSSITVSQNGSEALLADTEIEITAGTETGQVMVTKEVAGTPATYVTEWVDPNTLGNTVTADNGLTKTDNNIQLGGELTQNTIINTVNTTSSTTHTLAIKGLEAPSATDEAQIVMADNDGVLRNVARSLTHTTSATMTVNASTINGYNGFVPEITISATIQTTGDIDITLPPVADAKGQVINVKIANTDESHAGYLNIKASGTEKIDGLAEIYGAMPYQGWIIKSNGTSWSVVGRM